MFVILTLVDVTFSIR